MRLHGDEKGGYGKCPGIGMESWLSIYQAKPYDSKKSMWCPDGEGGFKECLLESSDGAKTTVAIGHEKKTFKADLVGQVNSSFGLL